MVTFFEHHPDRPLSAREYSLTWLSTTSNHLHQLSAVMSGPHLEMKYLSTRGGEERLSFEEVG